METIINLKRESELLNVKDYVYNDDTWIDDFFRDVRIIEKGKKFYYNIACAFDIETTNIPYRQDKRTGEYTIESEYYDETLSDYVNIPLAFMWSWQIAFKNKNNEVYILGRKWKEFLYFMDLLRDKLSLDEDRILVFYVHNLAFEFQFIQTLFSWSSVFARKSRKVMKCTSVEGIEFRCSYFLSNMNLAKFIENTEGTVHGKKVGSLDYRIYRDWTSHITENEKEYIVNDVLGLVEAIDAKLKEDTITSIPLTSTGYVRREIRNRCFSNKWYRKKVVEKQFPDLEVYMLCRKAFRGGDTHANYTYANQVMENMFSYDLKSGYPAWILYEEMPTGKAQEYIIYDLDRLAELIDEKLLVMEIEFYDLVRNENDVMTYIDLAHCSVHHRVIKDNGRVLSAEYVRYYCTSLDLKIILAEYSFSAFKVLKCFGWEKALLPLPIREGTLEYFNIKTVLDGVEEKYYEYVKGKNNLNAVYGMMVTALENDEIVYERLQWREEKADVEEALERNFRSYNTFLMYQWGIFITAYARLHLHEVLQKIGSDAVYVDTDSIKFIGEHNKIYFEEFNRKMMDRIAEVDVQGISYTPSGERKVMGLWEIDGIYDEFKTLGAKKYLYKSKGKYTVTVSGMNKKLGSSAIKSMDDFVIGKTFDNIGRTTAFYNDNEIFIANIKGVEIEIVSNVALQDTTYTLGISDDYADLIIRACEDEER